MPLVHLVNPNTTVATTDMMVGAAREAAPAGMEIAGLTARRGAALIIDAAGLATGAAAVLELAGGLTGAGVIVAAFGDPGADELGRRLAVPVIGIGEASIRLAGRGGRRFSIASTSPGLSTSIRARVEQLGLSDQLASLRVADAEPVALTADAEALEATLFDLVERSVAEDGAQAVVIGGGPLTRAARAIAGRTSATIIEPVPAAVAWMADRLGLCR